MALRPIYIDERTGLAGFGPEDFYKIVEGYACARCFEEFACYTFKCPVCGLERDLERDIQETPTHWLPSPEEENIRSHNPSAWDEAHNWLAKKRR